MVGDIVALDFVYGYALGFLQQTLKLYICDYFGPVQHQDGKFLESPGKPLLWGKIGKEATRRVLGRNLAGL